jgi:hypothetical protein
LVPRTNYQRASDRPNYDAAIDQWSGQPSTSRWRVAWRRMTAAGNERGLHASLLQPAAYSIDNVQTLGMADDRATVILGGLWSSIPFDALLKVTGATKANPELVARFPAPLDTPYADAILLRTLRLNCLTADYAPLWEELFDPAFTADAWAEPAITGMRLGDIGPTWTMATPLRTDYDRRKALVELDALAGLALGLTADQLCAMYASQFAVLRKYEYNMRFTNTGRRIAKDHQQFGFHQVKGDWEAAVEDVSLHRPHRETEMRAACAKFGEGQ